MGSSQIGLGCLTPTTLRMNRAWVLSGVFVWLLAEVVQEEPIDGSGFSVLVVVAEANSVSTLAVLVQARLALVLVS